MPLYTVESSYRFPACRRRRYEAPDVASACRAALHDDDWDDQKFDIESADETYVSALWSGDNPEGRGTELQVPSEFQERTNRQTDLFRSLADALEEMVGELRFVHDSGDIRDSIRNCAGSATIERAEALVAKARAIMAGEPDPSDAVPPPSHRRAVTPLDIEALAAGTAADLAQHQAATTATVLDTLGQAFRRGFVIGRWVRIAAELLANEGNRDSPPAALIPDPARIGHSERPAA